MEQKSRAYHLRDKKTLEVSKIEWWKLHHAQDLFETNFSVSKTLDSSHQTEFVVLTILHKTLGLQRVKCYSKNKEIVITTLQEEGVQYSNCIFHFLDGAYIFNYKYSRDKFTNVVTYTLTPLIGFENEFDLMIGCIDLAIVAHDKEFKNEQEKRKNYFMSLIEL